MKGEGERYDGRALKTKTQREEGENEKRGKQAKKKRRKPPNSFRDKDTISKTL